MKVVQDVNMDNKTIVIESDECTVNISKDSTNTLTVKEDGLYVASSGVNTQQSKLKIYDIPESYLPPSLRGICSLRAAILENQVDIAVVNFDSAMPTMSELEYSEVEFPEAMLPAVGNLSIPIVDASNAIGHISYSSDSKSLAYLGSSIEAQYIPHMRVSYICTNPQPAVDWVEV